MHEMQSPKANLRPIASDIHPKKRDPNSIPEMKRKLINDRRFSYSDLLSEKDTKHGSSGGFFTESVFINFQGTVESFHFNT